MRTFSNALRLAGAALVVAAATAWTATPIPSKPPLQVFDEMIRQLHVMQAAMQKESAAPTGHWQNDLVTLTEPLNHSINDLTRSGMRAGNPSTAFGLRVLVNSLHSAHDPKQAAQWIERLTDTVSFLRSEQMLATERPAAAPATGLARLKSRDVALEILRRPEFHPTAKPHFFDYYLNRLIARAVAWVQGLFDSNAMRQATRFAYLLLWGVYLALGGTAVWLLHRTWSPRRPRVEPERQEEARSLALVTPEAHLAEAEAFRKKGEHGAAVRAYFLMLLATLEQRHFVVRNRSWTNWEYLRAFSKRVDDKTMRGRLSHLNRVYDAVGYGGERCDETRCDSFREDVTSFLDSLNGGEPKRQAGG